MYSYKLTNKAVKDLTEIWDYTYENWSEEQADKYYKLLIDNFKFIAENPNIGKKYSEVAAELRGLKVNKHIVFYRQMNELSVEITRILHERMDLKNRIKD